MKIFDQLRSAIAAPAASAANLRTALAALDIPAIEAAVTAAEADRAALLLGGSDADLDRADAALKTATRERDRAMAARDELSRRLAEAEVHEAGAALDAEREAVATQAKAIEAALRRWPELQAEIIGILTALGEGEAQVNAINLKLVATGRTDTLPEIEARVFPPPPNQYREIFRLGGRVVLPVLEGVPGWRSEPMK